MTREEAIKIIWNATIWTDEEREALAMFIPELRESEDEKDRQHIIRILDDCYAYGKHDLSKTDHENLLAWLEKQKEEEEDGYEAIPIESTLEYKAGKHAGFLEGLKEGRKQKEQKPIFRVGDILKKKGKEYTFTVDKIQGGFYLTQDEHFFPIEEQDTWELVEQKEQKPVVTHGETYHVDTLGTQQVIAGKMPQKPVHTAKEAWKEMRLEVYAQACGNRHEPNYSDDSAKMFSLCDIDEIFEKIGNSTVGSQPAEWSEEDEKKMFFLERLIEYNVPDGQYGWVDGRKGGFVTKSEAISMLKSLRPQYHGDVTMTEAYKMGLEAGKASSWKPSEEQIGALNEVINTLAASKHPHESDYLFNMLNGLRKDLKKL